MNEPDVGLREKRLISVKAALGGGVGGALAGSALFAFIACFLHSVNSYGTWLFLLVPVLMGYSGALIAHRINPTTKSILFMPSLISQALVAAGLLLWRYEGLVCLAMALPITLPLALLGASLELILRRGSSAAQVSILPVILIAAVWDAEHPLPPRVQVESTSIVIKASPTTIWPYIIRLNQIKHHDPLLGFGYAHPTSIWADGDTVGSHRVCRLTTGDMPEVVTDSVAGQLFGFKVLHTPASMIETNPFGKTDPPHLHDNYRSIRGEYRLTALAPGRTRVEGISFYSLDMAPEAYWTLWSDAVVDAIHRTDLETIRDYSEADEARLQEGSVPGAADTRGKSLARSERINQSRLERGLTERNGYSH